MSAPIDGIWHDVFLTGKADFKTKKEAVAHAMAGWAAAMAGLGPIPEKFGEGMVFINNYVGANLTPNNIIEFAESL